MRGIYWTILPDLASAPLNGQITNGTRSTVKVLPGSVLLCPGPVSGLLGWVSGFRSYPVWSLKWFFRYSPSETRLCQLRRISWTTLSDLASALLNLNHKWKREYREGASRLRTFVPETGARPVGMGLPRGAWVKLNCLRTGVGRFYLFMHK